MSDELTRFEQWLTPLIGALSSTERLRLSRELAQQLKRSQARRIAAQLNPDGTPFETRKQQATKQSTPERAAKRRQGIRATMFNKLRTARFLRSTATAEGLTIGFIGRVARIARVHQYGQTDQTQPGGPNITYPVRQLLGMSQDDALLIREAVLKHLDKASQK